MRGHFMEAGALDGGVELLISIMSVMSTKCSSGRFPAR
jgi:hypothetical protein